MAGSAVKLILLFNFLHLVYSDSDKLVNFGDPLEGELEVSTDHFVFWPNATVPFHINQDHFDNEQSLTLMRALSNFAFHSCLKFAPVMVPPTGNDHVMAFHNPSGARKCEVAKYGHPREGPHMVHLGYDCLKSPNLEMVIMRSLGFPFEHNRAIRDTYIDVQEENIEPGALELFTKEYKLPAAMRPLPYDVHSVLHFGERDYSKNGHRTIIFKDRNLKQNRNGLSDIDKKKIEVVYGPECRMRDRQEKIELCHQYPGNTERRKREVDPVDSTKSLRVNPDITPPPADSANNANISEDVTKSLKTLAIEAEVQEVVDNIYKISAKALQNARVQHCNDTKSDLRSGDSEVKNRPDIHGIIKLVSKYAQSVVDHAVGNLSAFCEKSDSLDKYQRFSGTLHRCMGYVDMSGICRHDYKSTKSGRLMVSTQHRPYIRQSTWHIAGKSQVPKDPIWRSGSHNESEVEQPIAESTKPVRKKREVEENDAEAKVLTDMVYGSVPERVQDVTSENRDADAVNYDMNASDRKLDESSARRDGREDEVMRTREKTEEDPHIRRSKHAKRSRKETEEEGVVVTKPNLQKPESKSSEESEEQSKSEKEVPEEEPKHRQSKPSGSPTTVELSKLNEEFYSQRRWPHGIVRYMIDKSSEFDIADLQNRLDEVNQILKARTCVKLQEIQERAANKYEDYLVLDNSPDYVTGHVGGKQFFGSSELLKGGQHRQHTAMMVMAMLGFYFEVSRHDRDSYIRVHMRHIRADKLHHFEKIRSDATLPIPYDYKSATHPAWQFWRKVGKTGISTVATFKDKDPDGSIMRSLGQNEELLSEGDLIKINSVYGIKCMKNGDGRRKRHKKRQSTSSESSDRSDSFF